MRSAPHRSRSSHFQYVSAYGAAKASGLPRLEHGGEGGIRTLGTLLGYGALAKRCFRPLSHLTNWLREYGEQLPIANSMHLPTTGLAILPFGFAFLNEGINAFLGVAREHVLDHYLGGISVGVLKPKFDLLVERFLADLDDIRRLRGDFATERQRLFALSPGSNRTINQTDAQGVFGRDHVASKQHFHGMFARNVARER